MQSHFQKRSIFYAAGFILLAFAGFFFLYRQININNKKYQESSKVWQKEASRREELRSLDSSVRKIEIEKTQLEGHFAESSNVVPFLDMIEGLGTEAGAKASISSVSISGDNSGLLVEVKAEGSFTSIYKFLTLMENSPFIIDFGSVELHGGPSTTGGPAKSWSAEMKVKLISFTS